MLFVNMYLLSKDKNALYLFNKIPEKLIKKDQCLNIK